MLETLARKTVHGMRGRKASQRTCSIGARARLASVGAHALRVDAAMATRLRVAVVGQFSPPELIICAGRGAKVSRSCGAPIEIAALR